MLKRIAVAVLSTMFLTLPIALAQQAPAGGDTDAPVDAALLEQGQQLFVASGCIECHQPSGQGIPPDFPALAGNERLADPQLIVGNVHQGAGAMPAFPDLTPPQIAALATYVRNTWGNEFGGVTPEQVAEIMAALPPPGEQVSVWTGVYSAAQAERGRVVYSGTCAKCHGRRGDGAAEPDQVESPSIARSTFLRTWDKQTVATLFEWIRTNMPQDNPKSLTDQQYIDAIAYMFTLSDMPPGENELPPDPAALASVVIEQQPAS